MVSIQVSAEVAALAVQSFEQEQLPRKSSETEKVVKRAMTHSFLFTGTIFSLIASPSLTPCLGSILSRAREFKSFMSFPYCAGLEEEQVIDCIPSMFEKEVAAGDILIRSGRELHRNLCSLTSNAHHQNAPTFAAQLCSTVT